MEFWHLRYTQQASWTDAVRRRAYGLMHVGQAERVLEVGCGTGVITRDLHTFTSARICGIDISGEALTFAAAQDPGTRFAQANGYALPFPAQTFDAAIAHYLLLWIRDPAALLAEMVRVVRPGGGVLCLAEPDYGGRIDHPKHLVARGQAQTKGLKRQGADPQIGRKLRGLLARAGVAEIQAGVLGAEWRVPPTADEIRTECITAEVDSGGAAPGGPILDALLEDEIKAWESGERVLFVPTFYAFGRRPAGRGR